MRLLSHSSLSRSLSLSLSLSLVLFLSPSLLLSFCLCLHCAVFPAPSLSLCFLSCFFKMNPFDLWGHPSFCQCREVGLKSSAGASLMARLGTEQQGRSRNILERGSTALERGSKVGPEAMKTALWALGWWTTQTQKPQQQQAAFVQFLETVNRMRKITAGGKTISLDSCRVVRPPGKRYWVRSHISTVYLWIT